MVPYKLVLLDLVEFDLIFPNELVLHFHIKVETLCHDTH